MKSTRMTTPLSLGAAALLSLAFQVQAAPPGSELNPNHIPHRINPGHPSTEAPTAGTTGQVAPVIRWGGGPVLTGAPNVHIIWYGNWNQANGSDTPAGQDIVRDFLFGVKNSDHMAINSAGYTGSNGAVSGALGSVFEGVSTGTSKRLKDADFASIVSGYITASGIKDTNAVYVVMTSSDVTATSGFCTKYCGWHTAGTIQGSNIKYSFVGNANRCLSGCAAQTVGPNGNAGVDGTLSVLMHEIEEAVTDPNPRTGWTDANGAENADKCAWTFGSAQQVAANGAAYNLTLPARNGGTRNYLIQRNLKATDSKCYVTNSGQQ